MAFIAPGGSGRLEGMAETALTVMQPSSRRFSIRLPRPLWIGLAGVVLLVPSVAVHFVVPVYRQHTAIEEIRRLGGEVRVSFRGPVVINEQFSRPINEAFGRVVVVDLSIPTVTDNDLKWLEYLPDVQTLGLNGSKVTDSGLHGLRSLPRLEWVWAQRTRVTSAGIARLHDIAPQIQVFKYWGRKLQVEEIPDDR